jgi:hypothetical protein
MGGKNMKYSMKVGSKFISIVGMRLGMIVIVTGFLRSAVNDCISLLFAKKKFPQLTG